MAFIGFPWPKKIAGIRITTARYAHSMRIIVLVLSLFAVSCATSAPDLVLAGGRVFTADTSRPWADAVAIRGDRIVSVGPDAEVRKLAGPATRIIELHGNVVVPGINDAHLHMPWGLQPDNIEIAEGATVEQVLESVAAAARVQPEGTVLRGDVPPIHLDDPRLSRAALDALTTRHPVLLSNLAGHAVLHNSAALRWRGVADDVRDTQAAWYGRDAEGRLNGWVYEHALWASDRRMNASLPDEPNAARMRRFAAEAVRYGITSVQSMPGIERDRAMRLTKQVDVPLRWRWMDLQVNGVVDAPSHPVKYILDGTPMEHGAAMRSDYADAPGHRGRLDYTDAELARIIAAAAKTRQPTLLHISGDLGIEKVFALMRATNADWPALRLRIEHGDFIGGFADEAKALGVVLVQNPSHFMVPEVMQRRFGAVPNYQVFRSFIERGIPVAIGSDGPVNPWLNVLFATMHPRNPAEAVTREQAVIAYTRGSAYAEFMEKEKGSIAPGMLADLAVLSQDVFTVAPGELPKTESVLTLIGGKVAWERKE
jgi:predicted amidohydrolase YtcJ